MTLGSTTKVKKKKIMAVYLVTGSTGEYADRQKWNVKGFATEAAALEFMDKIGAVIDKELGSHTYTCLDQEQQRKLKTVLMDIDPNVIVDYTGIDYEMELLTVEI